MSSIEANVAISKYKLKHMFIVTLDWFSASLVNHFLNFVNKSPCGLILHSCKFILSLFWTSSRISIAFTSFDDELESFTLVKFSNCLMFLQAYRLSSELSLGHECVSFTKIHTHNSKQPSERRLMFLLWN